MPSSYPHDIIDITADELRELIDSRREAEYVIIDVRQPQEYVQGHLPGARLVPLMEVPARLDEVSGAEHKIFYCRSGGRSYRAASHAALAGGLTNVYNLVGGTLGWTGVTIPDMPHLHVFDDAETLSESLLQAMELEKGAHRFYEALLAHFAGRPLESIIETLLEAETGHARLLYRYLEQTEEGAPEPFESLFARLPGLLLESGESFDALIERADELATEGELALLELAAEMELRAFDLYRNMAEQADSPVLREALIDLSNHEKHHARGVLDALGKLAEETRSAAGRRGLVRG